MRGQRRQRCRQLRPHVTDASFLAVGEPSIAARHPPQSPRPARGARGRRRRHKLPPRCRRCRHRRRAEVKRRPRGVGEGGHPRSGRVWAGGRLDHRRRRQVGGGRGQPPGHPRGGPTRRRRPTPPPPTGGRWRHGDSRGEGRHVGGGRRRLHLPAGGGDTGSPAPTRRPQQRLAADCEWRASRPPLTACSWDMRYLPHTPRRTRRPAAIRRPTWRSQRAFQGPTPRSGQVQRWSSGSEGQCGHQHEGTDSIHFAHPPRHITWGTTSATSTTGEISTVPDVTDTERALPPNNVG